MGLKNKIKNAFFNMVLNTKSFKHKNAVSTFYNGHIYDMTSYDLVVFEVELLPEDMYQVASVLNSYKKYADFTVFPIEKNGKIVAVEFSKIGANNSLYNFEKTSIRKRNYYKQRNDFEDKIDFLLEFIDLYTYLTQNNIDCDNLSNLVLEFYKNTSDNNTLDNVIIIRNIESLKIVEQVDILLSQQKLLSFVYEVLEINDRISISDLCDFDKRKYFFLSNDLFKLFKTSLVDKKIIKIEDLRHALIDQRSNISWHRDLWLNGEKAYDKMYLISPFDSSFNDSCLFVNMDELELLRENVNVCYYKAKSNRLKSLHDNRYFVICKDDTSFDLKEYYNHMKNVLGSSFTEDFKLLYSNDVDHPCGYMLNDLSVTNNPILEDITVVDNDNLFTSLRGLFNCLVNLKIGFKHVNIPLSLSDFVVNTNSYEKKIKLLNHSVIFDSLSSNQVEFTNDIIVDVIMEFVKLHANYKIEKNRVVFDEMSDIRCMAPTFIVEVENYLLENSNYSKMSAFNALEMTFYNLDRDKLGNVFYSRYIVSPKILQFVFEDEIDKSQVLFKDENEINYELQNKEVARIFKKTTVAKDALETLLEIVSDHVNGNSNFVDVRNIKKIIYKRKLKKVTSKKNSYSTFVISGVIYERKIEGISIRKLASNPYGFDNKEMLQVLEGFFFMCKQFSAKIAPYLILDKEGIWHEQLGSFSVDDVSKGYIPLELYSYIKDNILNKLNISMYSFDIVPNTYSNNKSGFNESDLYEIINKARVLLNTKCDKHNIWYRKDIGVCPICHKDSMLLSEYKKLKSKKKIKDINKFDLLKDNVELLSSVILNQNSDNTLKVEMYEYLIELSKSNNEISKYVEIPCLKLLDDNLNLIGYLYIEDEITLKWNDVFKHVIKSAIISSYFKVLIELEKNGLYVDESVVSAFKAVGGYSPDDFKIKLANLFAIKKIESKFNYEKTYNSFKEFGLNAKNLLRKVNYDKVLCEVSDTHIDKLLHAINMLNGLDKYCNIHNIYYSCKKDLICPECKKIHGLSYIKEDQENLELLSDEGGEALCYVLDNRFMLKRFRPDKKTQKLDPKDIEHNVLVCKELMAKSDILSNTLEKGYDFELVLPQGFEYEKKAYDTSQVTGIVFETIENSKPIRILENNKNKDKYHITRQNLFEMCIGIAHAMMYLHENGIYIGDVSTNNFLFKPEDKVKLPYVIDMNSVGTKNVKSYMYTRDYVDPKAIEDEHVRTNASTDLYALAILSFYLLTSVNPFAGTYMVSGKNMSISDRKKNKISVLGDHKVVLPPIFKWDWMSDELENAFLDIFEKDKRYNIADNLIQEYERLFGVEYPYRYKSYVKEIQKEDQTEKVEDDSNIQSLKEVSFDTVGDGTIPEDDDINVKTNKLPKNAPVLKLVREVKDKDNMCILSNHYDYLQKKDYDKNIWRRSLVHDGKEEIKFSPFGIGIFDTMLHDNISLTKTPYNENNSKRLYAVQQDKDYGSSCVWKFSSNQVSVPNVIIMHNTDILSIPYTDTFVYISADGFLTRYSAKDDSTKIISTAKLTGLKSHRISLNTRYSANDLASKEAAYIYVMENIVNKHRLEKVQIYVDMVSNRWLLVADTDSFDKAFMYDEKTGIVDEISISNIDEDVLNGIKSHMSGCIYIKNALYYLTDGKIVSVNISSGNVKEFPCSVADDNSRLEMIPNGFRIFTKAAIYDYVSN